MPIIPRIIPNTLPSCRDINSPHLGCLIRQLYKLVNANYNFLEDGLEELIDKILAEIIMEGTTASENLIDDLFNG